MLSVPDVTLKTVVKTLGGQEDFDREKLLHAIKKATGYTEDRVRIAEDVADFVMKKIDNISVVHTGFINALVEGYLLAKYEKAKDKTYKTILDKYIINKRRKQDELMQKVSHMKDVILGAESIRNLKKFSINQTQIAAARYLLRNIETGDIIETIPEWFHRVASHVVLGSIIYDEEIYSKEELSSNKRSKRPIICSTKNIGDYQLDIIKRKHTELFSHMKFGFVKTLKIIDEKLIDKYNYLYRQYYDFMYQGIFEPNTPTLLNMGTPSGAGSACFTIEVKDNMESIMKASHDAAFIFKTAGGFGTNISYVRPKGSPVGNTYNAATGIDLVLEQINFLTDLVKAGGKRRGANMGIMEYWHPQILEFIDYKLQTIPKHIQEVIDLIKTMKHPREQEMIRNITPPGKLLNFNVSVMFDEYFWTRYNEGKHITTNFNGKEYSQIFAHDLMKHIADNAWKSAEPGVLFADNANRKNPLRELWGDIKITNPCVSSSTRLHTNRGMKTVGELYENHEEIEVAVDTVLHKSFKRYSKANETLMVQKLASKVFKTSDSETLLRIETVDGYEIECTPYHPMILVDGSEKKAGELTTDDELLLQSSKGIFGTLGTSDIGALFGFAQNHMQLITPEDKYLDDVFRKYTNLNKFDNIYHVLKKPFIPNIYGEPKPLYFILDYGKFKVNEVPDVVWQGTDSTVESYLKLLFSTSAVCEVERNLIKYHNYDKRFLQDLQILLINFGIKSTIVNHDDNIYSLTVSGKSFKPFMYKVGLATSSKIRNINVPRDSTGEVKYFSRVSKITKLEGTHSVYDAEEYETHKLIFNGIITGNCSEQYMYHGESCTLGSINLVKMVDDPRCKFDYHRFRDTVLGSTRFLNDVLEVNQYPTEDIKKNSNITKRIGLGIMGLADALFKMKIPYNSKEGYEFMRNVAQDMYLDSVLESVNLAKERGACDAYKMLIESGKTPNDAVDRVYPKLRTDYHYSKDLQEYGVRNMWTTTIAPTGTISMIADCSNGLEPIYALVYKKTVQTGDHYYLNREFENALISEGLYSDEVIRKVEQNYGSVQGLDEIPKWMQDVFVTAMDLHWTDHVVAQAVWQQYIDNSISKTINMPYNVTPEDIEYAYVLSHELGLKGVSVYRDGSRHLQVLHTDTSVKQKEGEIGAKSEKEMTLIKKQLAPSAATIQYIMDNVKNKDILDRFMKYIDNDKQQIYIQSDEICSKCNKGVIVNQGGCKSCITCGYSISCSVG
jgi:ribonucleoside-diphosphate reductase alpha chain